MKRRVIAAIGAVLLALAGAVLLRSYVAAADQRALAGTKTVTVLVVTKAIPEGTSATALSGLVKPKLLPAVAVTAGSVSDVSELGDRVATSDLVVGEQLLASRFADASTVPNAGEVVIPAGLQQVSVNLDAQRVLGGHLAAGATVGVFLSLPKDGNQPAQTHLALNKVLVSRVDGGSSTTTTVSSGTATPAANAATATVTVTLATSAANAELVVFGAEHGTLWLSLEPADVNVSGTRVVTAESVKK